MKPKCQHCNDTGRIAVEPGSTLGYTCPDCGYEEACEELNELSASLHKMRLLARELADCGDPKPWRIERWQKAKRAALAND